MTISTLRAGCRRLKDAVAAAAGLMFVLATAPAGAVEGGPEDWQLGFQPAGSPVMEQVNSFNNLLLVIVTVIAVFVLLLLLYVAWRFRESRNPNPSKTSHHTVLEIVWTAVPVIILVVIAVPSFKLLYFMDQVPDSELTVKAVGHQWYWSYEYPDNGDIAFSSYLTQKADLEDKEKYLFEADPHFVLPAKTNIRILVTATDVLHSFAVPRFGIKIDAIPGQLNETWVRIEEPGIYYGQCSELCGAGHADMPIVVEAVPKDQFQSWVEQAQEEYASRETPNNDAAGNGEPRRLASAAAAE
jgi:cytochrome c oxidase subunit 2